ncbi:MAG: DUF3060 domain-containing protein [Myxococcota bacterium]
MGARATILVAGALLLAGFPAQAEDPPKPEGQKVVSKAGSVARVTAAAPTEADDDDGPDVGEGAAVVKRGNKIQISGTEKVIAQKCTAGVEVYVSGNHNLVTISGECKLVNVSGLENNVRLEAAQQIVLSGKDNAVSYKRGIKTADPEIITAGIGNKATKVKPAAAP